MPRPADKFQESGHDLEGGRELVNGSAYGGGCETALSSDFVYAAKTAKFALTEITLGIILVNSANHPRNHPRVPPRFHPTPHTKGKQLNQYTFEDLTGGHAHIKTPRPNCQPICPPTILPPTKKSHTVCRPPNLPHPRIRPPNHQACEGFLSSPSGGDVE